MPHGKVYVYDVYKWIALISYDSILWLSIIEGFDYTLTEYALNKIHNQREYVTKTESQSCIFYYIDLGSQATFLFFFLDINIDIRTYLRTQDKPSRRVVRRPTLCLAGRFKQYRISKRYLNSYLSVRSRCLGWLWVVFMIVYKYRYLLLL